MNEIERRDRKLFTRELVSPRRLALLTAALALAFWIPWPIYMEFGVLTASLLIWGASSFAAAKRKRFCALRYKILWDSCKDRFRRFEAAVASLRRDQIADLQDLPTTVHSVSESLYLALRRADLVMDELARSEGWLAGSRHSPTATSSDPQSQALYQIADKNLAEYRQHYQSLIAGAQRAEAQAAVYTTTLDVLRMKVLGYRLVARETAMDSGEFLAAMTEARMQLSAIDQALEELELTPFPKTIEVLPESQPTASSSAEAAKVDPPPFVEPANPPEERESEEVD